jgi:hypothetical protein
MTEKEASESGKTEENRSDDREKGGRSTETQTAKGGEEAGMGEKGPPRRGAQKKPLGRQKESIGRRERGQRRGGATRRR